MKKGNMLIAQSGGPSMVINQSLVGAVLAARANRKVGKIYGSLHGIQGILDEQFIDLRKESARTLEAVAATPSSALGSVRRKPTHEDCIAIFAVLKKLDIRYFFYIGGNDSAETAYIINEEAVKAEYGISCVHIPKTIDNDLRENDHTPGYGSAARFVACAVRGDDLDNRALGGVKIDVIMGRNAGFLTAAAALARVDEDDGPHLIYLPERPFSIDRFIKDVKGCMKKYGRCVVAVSEGICDKDGTPIIAKFTQETDSHGNVQLSGTGALGDLLAKTVKERAAIKRVRADTFGYLQRSFPGIASEVDSKEARAVGVAAVQAAVDDDISRGSVVIRRKPTKKYGIKLEVVPLRKVARETRSMPDAFINRAGNHVTQAFLDYARPLVGALPLGDRFEQLKH
ncbi:MAG: 6-phosphofructokinase [Kiritimatiellae bacterium]|nr:6-phosphofructokinase [Kiritimatiellia bacterium]MBP5226493.1 6-phosphofructokinase [Kiritimatiellia bacterium]